MSSTDGRQLTTTSYAILGLLAVRPWSTYELAKQMRRTLHFAWPRAESNVYAEPKRLVEAGLATAEVQATGKRTRTLYNITPKGRDALELWLSTESAPSRFESETLLKVLFGNYGAKEELLATLRGFGAEASEAKEFWTTVADEFLRGAAPFPARVHVNALFFRLFWLQAATHAAWAEWAIEHVESWPDTATPVDVEASLDVFRSALQPAAP